MLLLPFLPAVIGAAGDERSKEEWNDQANREEQQLFHKQQSHA
jgi:hypothetical protein